MAGSIQKIGNKYRITLELGKDEAGKRLRKYMTVNSQAEAKKVLSEHEYNSQRNLLVQHTEITVRRFLEHWVDNYVIYNCEETTLYGYSNIINSHIIPFLGNVELQKLQPIHIQQYYKHLMENKKLSPTTVHRHHAIIRKSLDYALKLQFVYRNIADAVALPKKVDFTGSAYTKEQLNLLFMLVQDTKLELPVYLAGFLGLRRSEITGLKWDNVNFTDRVIYIQNVRTSAGKKVIEKLPKTKKSKRTLYIVDEIYGVLMKHQERQNRLKKALGREYLDSGYVVVKDNGSPYRVNTITEQFSSFLEKQKMHLPKIRLHDLRHTFCSILYAQKVDLKAISEAMGHSDIGTTSRIYTHLFDQTHKETVNAISEALKK